MKYFKKLVGDRIYLSPRSMEDSEKFTEWLNDFEITDYIGKSRAVITVEAEKKYLEESIPSNVTSFAIVTLEENKFIGTVSLENYDGVCRTATLGIFIGDRDYLGNGYGTEAIRLILEYGFKYLNLNNINLDVLDCNERAKRCYQKCGFKECGRRREGYFVDGRYIDKISMDILSREFEGEWIRNKNV